MIRTCSDRFVKKTWGGSPTGKRVEAPQALTCNTNTGVRIDPPGAQIDGDSGGGQKIIGRVEPHPPGKSDPAYLHIDRVLVLAVDKLMFVDCRCQYLDVSSVNGANDVGEAGLAVELQLLLISFRLAWQMYPVWQRLYYCLSHYKITPM